MITKRQVLSYVRNRNDMSAKEKEELFSPENINATKRFLNDLRQDIEAQFIACDARLADMRAEAATAAREDPDKPIEIQMGVDPDTDEPIFESHPPMIALDKFTAKEKRWQVRTKRFGYLIESAIEDANEFDKANEDERLKMLLSAIERHQLEMEDEDLSDADEDLYQVAETLRARTV